MSQARQILAYLQQGKEITPLEALRIFGCLRLAARIYDLRKEGVHIVERDINAGRKSYAAYRLA